MKILNVVGDLQKGGTQRAAQNFCEGYFEIGNDSRMLAYNSGGIRKEELEYKGIKCWVGEESLSKINSWKPDAVHYHSHRLSDNDLLRIRETFRNSKFVETNVFSKPTILSNEIIASYQLSNWCKFLYELRGGRRENSPIIPYPVKTDTFFKENETKKNEFKEIYDIPKERFLFGRIGQNFIGKWSNYIIEVFERFVRQVDSKTHLVIVNAPKEVLDYVAKKDPFIKERITSIDKLIGDDKLRQCYNAIDVFLLIVNQGESFGLVATESLLCETPVITLNTPWADNSQAEVVGVGGTACCSIEDFFSSMEIYFRNNELLKKKGKEGKNYIIERYDYKQIANQSLMIIQGKKPENKNCINYNQLLTDACNSKTILWLRKYAEKYPGGFFLKKLIRKKIFST